MTLIRNILVLVIMLFQLPYPNNSCGQISGRDDQLTYNFRNTVKVKDYFEEIDHIVSRYNSLTTIPLTEHLIIRNNPWIIDSLSATDYYHLKEQGITSLDPKELTIFKPGDSLIIPDSLAVDSLQRIFDQTYLDLNIPEFKFRIILKDSIVHEFPVRVGRNERKYLAMAGRIVDLRTQTGRGKIVRIIKNPTFINPVNNHVYRATRRDDGVLTGLPNVPWLEPEVNGVRYGQLIHPTTNIETLGRAYSNGCIGTSEAAAWYIYYHAPIGTRITIRYDLQIIDKNGNTKWLPNIYDRQIPEIENPPYMIGSCIE